MINMNSKILSSSLLVFLFSIFLGPSIAQAESMIVEDYQVDYEIDGGNVLSMELDSDFIELIIGIDSTNDGIMQITFPRSLLDATFDGQDDIFFVVVDGFETEYLELTEGANSRTIVVPFFVGDSQIEIIGTEALEVSLDEIIFDDVIPDPVIQVPPWVKSNAGWWADNQIGDADFVQGIQFLITENIITIPPTESGTSTSQEIPNWIKSNAGWWSDNLISDTEFVQGIQFLITTGIMKV
jgi:hypothetical protein